MKNVFLLVHAFGMHLGIARTSDTKITVALFELTYKLNGVPVVPLAPVLILHLIRQVTAKGHDVADPRFLNIGYTLPYRFLRRIDARKVRK